MTSSRIHRGTARVTEIGERQSGLAIGGGCQFDHAADPWAAVAELAHVDVADRTDRVRFCRPVQGSSVWLVGTASNNRRQPGPPSEPLSQGRIPLSARIL